MRGVRVAMSTQASEGLGSEQISKKRRPRSAGALRVRETSVVLYWLHVGRTAAVVGTIFAAAVIALEAATTASAAMTTTTLTAAAFKPTFAAIGLAGVFTGGLGPAFGRRAAVFTAIATSKLATVLPAEISAATAAIRLTLALTTVGATTVLLPCGC